MENKTIYVGDIINTVEESFLREQFGPDAGYGEIYSLTIGTSHKKTITNKYAFITYGSQEEAERVVKEMNYTKLDGHAIRVSLAHPDFQKIRSSGKGNVVLRNLDPEIDQRQLYDAFSQFGEIISCKIPVGKDGVKFGVAYIQFKNPDEAQEAIEELKGMEINGREITIGEFNATEISTNIHIKSGIPKTVSTTQELKAFLCEFLHKKVSESPDESNSTHFQNLERAVLLKLPNDPDYRQAYLTFSDPDSTAAAQDLLESHELTCERVTEPDKISHMKQNSQKWEQFKTEESSKRVLFVKNIPVQMTSQELQNFFSQFADVSKCVVNSKGDFSNAFVTFRTEDGAKYALKKSVLACTHLDKKQRRGQRYPLQLFVAAYMDRNTKIRKVYSDDRAAKKKKIDNIRQRVINEFGNASMQAARFVQLSDDQAAALAEDDDLYEDWCDADNNKPYEEDEDDEDSDDDEEKQQPFVRQRGRGRGPQRVRQRGPRRRQFTYRPPQRGRGKRGGGYSRHDSDEDNKYSDDDNVDDDDDFDDDSDDF